MKVAVLMLLSVFTTFVQDGRIEGRAVIPEGAVVAGVAVDSDGDPVPGISVALLAPFTRGHGLDLIPAFQGATDDRGEFRVRGVRPGSYSIVGWDSHQFGSIIEWAGPRLPEIRGASALRVSVPTYYPGAVSVRNASLIRVSSASVEGVTLTIRRAETYKLRARAEGAPAGSDLRVVVEMADVRIFGVQDEEGRVPPGRYFVRAESGDVRNPIAFGAVTVDVTDRDVDVVVRLKPNVRLTGRVRNENGALPKQAHVFLAAVDPAFAGISSNSAMVQGDGSFLFENVVPAAYHLALLSQGPAVAIESLRYGGNVLTRPLVDLTTGPAGLLEVEVAGPTGGLHVLVPGHDSPTIASVWRAKSVNNAYRDDAAVVLDVKSIGSVYDLLPGDYFAVVWEEAPPGAFAYDVEFLSHFDEVAGQGRVRAGVYSDIHPARISSEAMRKVLERDR